MPTASLDAFLDLLIDRLRPGSPELMPLATQRRISSKLEQWREMLMNFQFALRDTNEKQETNVEVKTWLGDVQDVADDVEDILDEFAIQASRLKSFTGKESSLRKFIPFCFTYSNPGAVAFDASVSSKILDISSRLEKVNITRYALGLKLICRVTASGPGPQQREPGLPTEPDTYGRDEDKTKIIEMVLKEEPCIIPIVGKAGVGKTTLAQLVYNDEVVVEDFKPRGWVCVSHNSDALSICNAILESVTSESCNLMDLNEVQIQLTEALAGRKFLLVLDDVSVSTNNSDLWETLKSTFMVGVPGSKIIVTTRSADIAFTIDANTQPYNLEVLSDDDCWSVFTKYATARGKDVAKRSRMDLSSYYMERKIISRVLGEEHSDANFSIIPIVGPRGVGKTILAQHVYDQTVGYFKPRVWVCVSHNSDALSIAKAILESFTSESCHLMGFNEVQIRLTEVLTGNKFLLVLDGVSCKNYELWESLKSSFMAGAAGSKIIVTTRRTDIAFTIDPNVQPYNLEVLSDDDGDKQLKNLELIRKKVVERCKGFPLAARFLGYLLRFEWRNNWESVLNSELWDLAYESEILPVLR